MEVPGKFIDDAATPACTSQVVVPMPALGKSYRSSIRPFGDRFCLFYDGQLVFWNPTPGIKKACVVNEIPYTRSMIGMEAWIENRTVVLGHFNYPGIIDPALIKFDIYSVDKRFKITLVRSVCTKAKCCAGGMLARFASPKIGEYVAYFGDLGNNDFFKTFHVSVKSNIETIVQTRYVELKTCPIYFGLVGEKVYPGPGTMFECEAFPVPRHLDCIYVAIKQVRLRPKAPMVKVFERVIRLPSAAHHISSADDVDEDGFDLILDQMVQVEDGTDRALLRVYTQTELCVYLLLHLQNNSVLEMDICDTKDESSSCINDTADRIMRFAKL